MDRISHLPDELLFKILLSLPTKDVVVTMVLSKRWKFLWTLVPRLEYDHNMFQDDRKHRRFSRFVYGSLLLHEAPVLESLLIKLGGKCGDRDVGLWIRTAFNRCVRQLDIEIDRPSILNPVTLPWNLFSGGCRMLVTLKLSNMMLVNASSLQASFPLLKKLSLVNIIRYPSEKFVNNFLSSCPILEDLVVEQLHDDNLPGLVVKIPSLKRLLLRKTIEIYHDDEACGFVIDAPCLESFDILDHSTRGFCYVKNNMPQIEYANLDIYYSRVWKVLGTITSVKRLYFCLKSLEEAYPVGSVFNSLVHLTICTCCPEWLNLLMCMLRVSPKLQALKLDQCHYFWFEESCPCWKEPSSVPECLLSSLETLEWVRYQGAKEEKEVVAFIFKSARCLKKATISSKYVNPSKKLEMLKELSFLSRCSSTCHLTFN